MGEWRLYPCDWLRCPVCGEPALDGHLTCGRATCQEGAQRDRPWPRHLGCLAYLDDGTLCGRPATAVHPVRWIMVCAEHAPNLL